MYYNWNSELVSDVLYHAHLLRCKSILREQRELIVVRSSQWKSMMDSITIMEDRIRDHADLLDIKYGRMWLDLLSVVDDIFR